MSWVTTKDGRQVNTDWFDDEDKKQKQIEANKKEADKKQAESDNKIEYADNLPKEMRKHAESFSNQFQSAVDELVERHNKDNPEDDLEDYLWEHIYDAFPNTFPDDMSIFVFDNNRGNYDKDNGKIGSCDVRFYIKNNKTVSIEMRFGFTYMDDVDDEYLEMMGVDVRR